MGRAHLMRPRCGSCRGSAALAEGKCEGPTPELPPFSGDAEVSQEGEGSGNHELN